MIDDIKAFREQVDLLCAGGGFYVPETDMRMLKRHFEEHDALAEGRDNIQQDLDGIVRKHAAMALTCDALQSENRELRRDKARMDWLTETQYWSLYQDADAQNAAFSFLLIKRGCKFYGTARSAIDAAMQAQSEQEQKCK